MRRSFVLTVVLPAVATVFVSSFAPDIHRKKAAPAEKSEGDAEHLSGVPLRGPETLFFQDRFKPLSPFAIPFSTQSVINILNNNGNGYAGVDFTHSGGFVPPDSCGAAGPASYIETVNEEIALYSPKGTGATANLDGLVHFFFTVGALPRVSGSSSLSDAIMIYDELIGRFIVGVQDVDATVSHASNFVLAVSTSNNPATLTAADWNFYVISTTEAGFDADYPGNLGYNADALVFTLNMYSTGGANPPHVLVTSVSATDLVNGVAQASFQKFQTDSPGFGLRPVTMHGAVAGGPMWLLTEHGDHVSIDVVKMTNVLSAPATFTATNVSVPPYSLAVAPRNPDGTTITTRIDSAILKAAEANNTIVAAHTVGVSATQDAARWYIINVTNATPTLTGQGLVTAGANTYITFPAIDINPSGVIGMTYMKSGTNTPTNYMSMYVTGRLPTDPAGTMQSPVLVPAGTGQTNYSDFGLHRAGDLSGINVDPSDGTFWVASEWATSNSGSQASANWGTAIANFSIAAPALHLTVNKTADTNDGVCDAADCSLREALGAAGGDATADTITFSIPANSAGCVGTDCTISLTSPLVPAADAGNLTTIDGGAASANTITLSGGGVTQILNVVNGAKISVDTLNFTGGTGSNGGAIALAGGGTLTLSNCAIFGNTASLGGAIYTDGGSVLNLMNVTISGNTTTGFRIGGGIYHAGAATVDSSTISNNSASFEGGVALVGSGTFNVRNTIIAENTASSTSPDANGNFTSQGYNLIGDPTGANGFTATGDQTGVNPQLAPLGNYGGPTQTHALQIGSPAINTGSGVSTRDQRGLPRPFGAAADKGAYELQPESYSFWASYIFPPGTPAASVGFAADPDGDGIPNWLEQFTGRNPLAPDSPASILQVAIASGNLVLQYQRSITADPAKVFVEQSLDLQLWTTTGISYQSLGPANATAELIQALIPIDGALKKFGRLHYTP